MKSFFIGVWPLLETKMLPFSQMHHRLHPTAMSVARTMGKTYKQAGMRSSLMQQRAMPILQVGTFQTIEQRNFSTDNVSRLMMDNDTRVMWTSPLEQMNDAVDAVATKTEFASLSDLGYSLSDIAIRSLDVIHTTTGLPWWATIVATTIAVRGIFFPITIISMKNAARMKLAQPHLDKLKDEMEAAGTRDPNDLQKFRKKYKDILAKYQVRPLAGMLVPMSQIPIFLGFFWGLQDIAKYFPEYSSDGALWFVDLSAKDPMVALPVISSALMIMSLEIGGDALPGNHKEQIKFGMRCFALAMIPLTMNFSSGVFVYWVTSNSFTVFQNLIMRVPGLKAALGIPEPSTTPQFSSISMTKATQMSPFQAAVTRMQKGHSNGFTLQTHVNKPAKKKMINKNNKQ